MTMNLKYFSINRKAQRFSTKYALITAGIVFIIILAMNSKAFTDDFNSMNLTSTTYIADDGIHLFEYNCFANLSANVMTSNNIIAGNCVEYLSGYPNTVSIDRVINPIDSSYALKSEGYHAPTPGTGRVYMYDVNFGDIPFDSEFTMDADLYWECTAFSGSCASQNYQIEYIYNDNLIATYDIDLNINEANWTRVHILYNDLTIINASVNAVNEIKLRYLTFSAVTNNDLRIDNVNIPFDPCGNTYIEHAINCNWLRVRDFNLTTSASTNQDNTIFGRIYAFTYRQGILWITIFSYFILGIMVTVFVWLIFKIIQDAIMGIGKTTMINMRFKK